MKLWQQHCVLCSLNWPVKSMLVFCYPHNTKANPTGNTKNNTKNSEVSGRPCAAAGMDHCGYSISVQRWVLKLSEEQLMISAPLSGEEKLWRKKERQGFDAREKELCNGLFISLFLLLLPKAHICLHVFFFFLFTEVILNDNHYILAI